MKLWEIKANALKLMFADSDVQFSKEEFENGSLESNGNTRDKLVRMNDSIRRAIDLYYQHCGQFARRKIVKYKVDEEDNVLNVLDSEEILDFGEPSRVDLRNGENVAYKKNLEYYFDNISKEVFVEFNVPQTYFYPIKRSFDLKDFEFILHYIVDKKNLPNVVYDLTFDLNTLNIPEDIQRMIPKYIKSEIYEEDEYSMAQLARQEYIGYLATHAKKYSTVQTRVKNTSFKRG